MPTAPESSSVPQLVGEIVDDARELVQAEVALAKTEALAELGQLRTSAILFVVAALTAVVALSLTLVAIALATGAPALTAGILAGVMILFAVGTAFWAKKALPTELLGETQRRLKRDLTQLEERGAWITAPTKKP